MPRFLKPAAFWTSYVLGTVVMIFSFLLAQAPRGRNTNFTLDYTCWSSSAILMLVCILAARRMWRAQQKHEHIAPYVVAALACLQLAFSIYGILSFATSQ